MPIHLTTDDHVVTITIDRPARRNALDLEHFDALADAWKRFRDDADAWVADRHRGRRRVLRRRRPPRLPPAAHRRAGERTTRGTRPVPLGHRGGAARPRHLQADHRRGERAVRRGRHGAAQRHRHPHRVPRGGVRHGRAQARHLRQWRHERPPAAADPVGGGDGVPPHRRAGARDAARWRWGCSTRSCRGARLLDRAYEWAARITENAPLAVAATKESALRGLEAESLAEALQIEARISARVLATDDAREGPRAFTEKRAPRWTRRPSARAPPWRSGGSSSPGTRRTGSR